MTRLPHILACVAACLATAGPALASGPAGSLTQLPGTAGCITTDGKSNGVAAQCADGHGRGLGGAESIVISPDGRFAYTYSYDSGAIAIIARDPGTGVLTQADNTTACMAPDGLGALCTDDAFPGINADSSRSIALSPDGTLLFATGRASGVSSFHRDASTGALAPIGCVSKDGKDADLTAAACTTFAPIGEPQTLVVSPDGHFLYAGSNTATYGVAVLSISSTGVLAPLSAPDGCFTATVVAGCTTARATQWVYDLAPSPDGHSLYAVSTDGAVIGFARDAGTGRLTQIAGAGGCVFEGGPGPDAGNPCTTGHGMYAANSATVSADGTLVVVGRYPGSGGGIAMLHRDPATGQLTQSAGAAGCVDMDALDGCATSRVTDAVYGLTFSPDGHRLFAASYGNGGANNKGISVFDVGPGGTLTQPAGAAGCYSLTGKDNTGADGACATARGIGGPLAFAFSPENAFFYATGYDDGGVAAFRLEYAPACSDASASTAFQTAVSIPVACTDTNGDAVVLTGASGPGHGSVSFNGLTATYTPAAGFSGDDTFQVKGNDGVNDSAPVTVTVHVGAGPPPPAGKKTPAKLSLGAKPKRDRTLPYRFTFSGKLTPAAGTTCSGKVVVTVKRGSKTVAKKTAKLASSCKWKTTVTFKNRKKLGKKKAGKLTARARYGGNAALNPKSSKAVTVRYG
jgi:WD40 repeat protein